MGGLSVVVVVVEELRKLLYKYFLASHALRTARKSSSFNCGKLRNLLSSNRPNASNSTCNSVIVVHLYCGFLFIDGLTKLKTFPSMNFLKFSPVIRQSGVKYSCVSLGTANGNAIALIERSRKQKRVKNISA